MKEIKKATEAIKTNYGIYEFFEAIPSQDANSPIPAGSIELRFYFTEAGVDTLLTGASLGEKEEPVADHIFGVRFLPGRSLYFDQVSVEELVKNARTGEPTELAKSLITASDLYTKSVLFMRTYEKCFEARTSRKELLIDTIDIDHYIRRRILERKGMLTIKELTEETGYSECYLRKIFSNMHGMPPKTYGQYIRLHHAMGLLRDGRMTLNDVADSCGYYDQSHMNKDFKKFMHCTPETFMRKSS